MAGNFNADEAIALAKEIGAGLAIPCHYEMFEFNSVSPGRFIQVAEDNESAMSSFEMRGTIKSGGTIILDFSQLSFP